MAGDHLAGDPASENIELVNTRSTGRTRIDEQNGNLTLPASRFITGGQTAK